MAEEITPVLVAVLLILLVCVILVVCCVPDMRKVTNSLFEGALVAHKELQDAEQRVEVLIRKPFAADPWAPLRATVAESQANGDY
uniref:hypothetical protein n=1 Tax=Saccharothrix mutabilis TaxID=33921 RepID=UPI0031D36A54